MPDMLAVCDVVPSATRLPPVDAVYQSIVQPLGALAVNVALLVPQ